MPAETDYGIDLRLFAGQTLRFCLRSCLLLLAVPLVAQAGLPKSSLVPGGVAVIPLGRVVAGAVAPQAMFGGQQVLVTSERKRWYAVLGLPLDIAPGAYELKVSADGKTEVKNFEVRAKDYPAQYITIKDKSKVELSDADTARAEREIAEIKQLKLHWRAAPRPDLAFIMPAHGRLASGFGLRRFFNGEPRLPHAGLDIAVKRGTPVKASGAGQVLAVGDYFFNGKTVFIDHGDGLITMYCHLDRIDVHDGDTVRKGQRIGRSGMTGRATGPHLHWSVILNGAMVNPKLFLSALRMQP